MPKVDVAKSLEEVNTALAELIEEGAEAETVEKTLTKKEFFAYCKEQLGKATEDEDPKPRLEHLAAQIEKAMGFDDADGVAFSIWTDSSMSASGQTRMADASNMHGDPPGARPAGTLPAAGIGTSGAAGSVDDSGTNPAPAGGVTTPGGKVVPPQGPPDGGGSASFDTAKNVAKSADGWESDLSSSSFLDKKPNSINDHLDFGPDVSAAE